MASALFDKVLSCPTLPSLPAVAVEVLRISRDPKAKLADIANVVQNDPGLSAKILKTVNSSLYGLKERCTRIDRAMGFMGMNTVKSIVLGLSVVDSTKNVKGGNGFDLTKFWRKTLYAAAAARQIALDTRACDPDEAFTAGLFQDIGILACITALKDQYAAVINTVTDPSMLVETEIDKLGFDHTEVGGELTTKWSLPRQYIDCIRNHHNAPSYSGEYTDLVRVVALGGFVADVLSGQDAAKPMARLRIFMSRWFERTAEDAEQLLTATTASASELAKLFDKNVGEVPDVSAIMAQAQELGMEHQVAVQQEAEKLREVNQALSQQNFTDTLTGIGNRRKFDGAIAEAMQDADGPTPTAMSVLFIDADKFKSVNDTHGHPTGDAVLVELARRLTMAIGEHGLVCRYGGEEFAILLPKCDGAAADALGERVRATVGTTMFDTSAVPGAPKELKVTVSVGVATRPVKGTAGLFAGATPEQLLKAADEQVYAAKQAGRNCVRIAGVEAPAPSIVQVAPIEQPLAASAQGVAPLRESRECTRVMVVEDDPLAAALLCACLTRHKGVELSMVERADEALKQVRALAVTGLCPDVVVCDLNTYGLTAIEFVYELRRDAVTRSIPVIITSATSDEATTKKCLEAGAQAFVSKGELVKDLARWVAKIVQEGRSLAKAA